MTVDEFARAERMGTRLGYLGLAPFVLGALAALLFEDLHQLALRAFLLYSIVILSFMGGRALGPRFGARDAPVIALADFGGSCSDWLVDSIGVASSLGARNSWWRLYRPVVC